MTRIEALRLRRRLTYQQVGERARPPATASEINKLAKGRRNLTQQWAVRLAAALDCTPSELFDDGASVPLRFNVYSAFAAVDAPREIPAARRLPAPAQLRRPEECFAADVLDSSADRLYPPGSTLFARELDYVPHLKVGQKVIVQRFRDAQRKATLEILAGVLDRSSTGDLLLTLRTRERELPGSVLIQAHAGGDGLRERSVVYIPTPASPIAYTPRGDDSAVILGVIAMAITPEED